MSNGLKKVGAAWIKDKRSGDGKYLSATVDCSIPSGAKLMIFKNDYKREDKHPDYNIFSPEDESKPATNGDSSAPLNTAPTQGPSGAQTRRAIEAAPAEDIPF